MGEALLIDETELNELVQAFENKIRENKRLRQENTQLEQSIEAYKEVNEMLKRRLKEHDPSGV